MRSLTTNTAPGSAGQNGARTPGELVVGYPEGGITGPTCANVCGPTVAGREWPYEIVTSGWDTVAIFPAQRTGGIHRARANAALYAAAPQMLEALRKLAAQCRAEFSVDGKWSNDGQLVTQAAVKAAESAIAAATGEAV